MEKAEEEEFWLTSQNKGFSFNEEDSLFTSSKAPSSCTKFQEKDASEKSKFHENKQSRTEKVYPKGSSTVVTHSESFKSLLLQGNVLQPNQKELKSRKGKTTPEQTVLNMIFGLDFSLEQHKSLSSKVALLNAAIKSNDGNAITASILHLRKSLKKSLFHSQIMDKPIAIDHYLHYLKINNEYDELSDLYLMLGKAEDAAMLRYSSTFKEQKPEDKIRKLEKCLNTHFQMSLVPPLFTDSLSEHISLLQRQLPIEEDDARQEKEGLNELFHLFPRKHILIDVPVITTLFYCCLYHYNLSENNFASPSAIKKHHQLTDKQYVWIALSALAMQHNWTEIENLFLSKSWLGNTRLKCCIGFNKAVSVLGFSNAPREILLKYIKLVEDFDERLDLAKKYKFHGYILEILKNARDRQGLLTYKSELSLKSVEYIETEEVLKLPMIKWKN